MHLSISEVDLLQLVSILVHRSLSSVNLKLDEIIVDMTGILNLADVFECKVSVPSFRPTWFLSDDKNGQKYCMKVEMNKIRREKAI